MRKLVLLLCTVFTFALVKSQTIKMKIASVTPTNGETVLAFQFADTLFTNITGGGSGIGTTKFDYIKFKKLPGLSSNELFKRTLVGTKLAQVDFEFYDSTNVLFYKIVLKDVYVSHFSYLSPECNNCSTLSHQVWMDYTKIEITDVLNGNSIIRYDRSTRTIY